MNKIFIELFGRLKPYLEDREKAVTEMQFQIMKNVGVNKKKQMVVLNKKRICDKCKKKDWLTEVHVIQDIFPKVRYHSLDGLKVCDNCLEL